MDHITNSQPATRECNRAFCLLKTLECSHGSQSEGQGSQGSFQAHIIRLFPDSSCLPQASAPLCPPPDIYHRPPLATPLMSLSPKLVQFPTASVLKSPSYPAFFLPQYLLRNHAHSENGDFVALVNNLGFLEQCLTP